MFYSHNFGHVAARSRSRMVQPNNRHTERSSVSGYFKGYYFSYNMFVTNPLIVIEGIWNI